MIQVTDRKVKTNRPNPKRLRLDDITEGAGAAGKLRRSIGSASRSASSIPAAGGRASKGISGALFPGKENIATIPKPSRTLKVKPTIKAKQTQLFGERVISTHHDGLLRVGVAGLPKVSTIGNNARRIKIATSTSTRQTTLKQLLPQAKGEVLVTSQEESSSVEVVMETADDSQSAIKTNTAVMSAPIESTDCEMHAEKDKMRMRVVNRMATDTLSCLTTADTTRHPSGVSLSVTDTTLMMDVEMDSAEMGPGHRMVDVDTTPVDIPANHQSTIIFASDRETLASIPKNSLKQDTAAHGLDWIIYHKSREHLFKPWQFTLSGKREELRLGVIGMYWASARMYSVSLATIYVAINNFGRLLNAWTPTDLQCPSPSRWAMTAFTAYRLAFKLEERPELLYQVNNFWDIFPRFSDWAIDRSPESMNQAEIIALNVMNDSMDVPTSNMFLSQYLTAGGWPETLALEYKQLAMYLVALSTFASTKDVLLRDVPPSKIAVAALVLAIKIINGDRANSGGIMQHLPICSRSTDPRSNNIEPCVCRYEHYPEKLAAYCNYKFSDIQPVIRGLSCLLRDKPEETSSLKTYFPVWGENDWQ